MLTSRSCLAALSLLGILATGCSDGRTVTTVERTFDAADADWMTIRDGAGDLEIYGEPGRTEVTLIASLVTHRVGSDQDDRAVDAMRIEYRAQDGVGDIIAALQNPPRGYHIDLVALVPEGTSFDLEDGSGDVVIEDIGELLFKDGSGDAAISGVGGDVDLEDGSGDLSLEGVDGSVEIHDDSGDMAIRHVSGDVVLYDGSGDIAVIDARSVDVRSDGSGDVAVVP